MNDLHVSQVCQRGDAVKRTVRKCGDNKFFQTLKPSKRRKAPELAVPDPHRRNSKRVSKDRKLSFGAAHQVNVHA
jgi:hypothetical protein